MTERFGHWTSRPAGGVRRMYRKQEWDIGLSRLKVVSPADVDATGKAGQGGDRPETDEQTSAIPPTAEARTPSPVPPAPGETAPAATVGANRPQRLRRRTLALGAALAIAVGAASWFGYDWWTVGRFTVSTDDAYVGAYNTTLAAKVPGYVASVLVTDNTAVHAGD